MVLSNKWKGVLSKLFVQYFGDRMCSIFPNLEQLTLISFNDRLLTSLLDTLHNLRKFHEIYIHHMYQITAETMQKKKLLDQIFTANNNRLDTILFDEDSMIFSLPDGMDDVVYSNIRRLSIDLKTINDLHRLLTLLPGRVSMNAAINKDDTELKIERDIAIIWSIMET